MSTPKGNAIVGQSGGPTAVINQSLVGVVLQAQKTANIQEIYGAVHGVRGIINENFTPMKKLGKKFLEEVAATPSAALGSTRDKPDAEYCSKIFNVMRKRNVRYFFYIGGNDSCDTARIVYEMAKKDGYALRVFHVPKTVDNDLRVTDHCPGFGSAARFVATAFMGDNLDNRSLPGVKVNVVMGRHAGFLTASSVLARQYKGDGPHLIYVPEAPVSEEKFLSDVKGVYEKLGRCVVAVSEGITHPNGKTWAEMMAKNLEQDAHGNIQLSGSGALGDYLGDLIKRKLGVKRVRSDTFGYLQRCFPACISESDAKEARLVGQMAVKYSQTGAVEGSVAMQRAKGKTYKISTILTPLSTVARETKHMDHKYIKNGNDITKAFIDYASPLVGKLPKTQLLPVVK